jgi:hypothetical protein
VATRTETEAWASLATAIGEALLRFAKDVSEPDFSAMKDSPGLSGTGPRQRQAYELLLTAPEDGLRTSEVAGAMRYDVPNAYLTLKSLANRGLAELIAGSSPQRWRAVRDRGSSAPYLAAAQLVRRGEWATYGDVSIAVRGDDHGARAVGRAAATLPDFPNPHRILQQGGHIPDGWRDGDGQGPDECHRRLVEEGIRFIGERADPAQRLHWEDLRQRLIDSGVDVPPLPSLDQ